MYKYCIVPKCTNTSFKTPEKLFFNVPKDPKLREKWFSFAKRDDKTPPSALATRHCCEDHFDIENDMENYVKYKLVGGILKLKNGILPHKFDCQQENKKTARSAVQEQSQIEMEMPTDTETYSVRNKHCCGCLRGGSEMALKQFNIQCKPLKEMLKVDSITLCYLCIQIARKAEYFIQNVQNHQIILQNIYDIPEIKQCPATLTQTSLPALQLQGAGDEESCTVISGIKMEPSVDAVEDYEGIFIKEENTSHNVHPKEEVTSEEDNNSQSAPKIERKRKRKLMDVFLPRKRKILLVKTSMSSFTGSNESEYTVQRVTEMQCMKEREERSQDSRYLSCTYRCTDCIKGFIHKTSFVMHMELHSSSRGDVVCDICKQRFQSSRKMAAHRKSHIYRYKCMKCDAYRISQSAIKTHYAAKHTSFGPTLHQCTQCPKVFKNKVSLRKHEPAHSRLQRVTCDACQLTFISKDTLRNHILRKHPPDGFTNNNRKRHVCQYCGAAFSAPYLLKNHVSMHVETRPYYCVECDKSFKTDKILTRHLKTASRHVFNADLHVSCDKCEKRFSCRRDLERHVNSVHLNLKPHACDKCDRAYLNSWSLREHKLYSHEGHRKERRYPCTLCDKLFDRSSILKSHIRTHTGERPYRCKHCPSQFVQSSQLRTHTNLVHLKLTRDGKPKSTALK